MNATSLYFLRYLLLFFIVFSLQANPIWGRTIVIGFDGLDPKIIERWMAAGQLPNFARLQKEGYYQHLATTTPAQSPVAWSSFATGLNPGEHGIFDFLRRLPENYTPDFAIAELTTPDHTFEWLGYQLALENAKPINRRVGKPFWISAEQLGVKSSILRVPVTYPADPVYRMLSGMGVPDLLGTQGTFTFYTTGKAGQSLIGGNIVRVKVKNNVIHTTLQGPPHPLHTKPKPLTIPLLITPQQSGVLIKLGKETLALSSGQWSSWVPVRFSFAGIMDIDGIVRFYLVRGFPFVKLYVSPINFDPRNPAGPIDSPPGFAAELASRIGLFHTLGMPEETWSLNEGRLDDDAYLQMVTTVLAEREAMFFDTLDRKDSDLIVTVFVQTDRISHMFWRGIDPLHPLHKETSAAGRNAILWIYQQADRILGKTLQRMAPEDRLIVLSDHGFAPYRKSVHLNRWLVRQGFLHLKSPRSALLFANVDWSKSQAYALGLNGVFINLAGREGQGSVKPKDVEYLKRQIIQSLEQWQDADGQKIISQVYDKKKSYVGDQITEAPDLIIGYAAGYRASWQTTLGGIPDSLVEENKQKWSGDHCIDPKLVPGVFFSSFRPKYPLDSITDVAALINGQLNFVENTESLAGSRGLFGVTIPLLHWLNRALSWLPFVLQLAIWALITSYLSMIFYRFLSNQKRLQSLHAEIATTSKELARYDGPLVGLWPLLGTNYRLAAQQLGHTLWPALLSSLPVIFILVWISEAYGPQTPQLNDLVQIKVIPTAGQRLAPLTWQAEIPVKRLSPQTWEIHWPEKQLFLLERDSTKLLSLPTIVPGNIIEQRQWWNHFIGNPMGYLPSPGVIETIQLNLPDREIIPFGPHWIRTWPFSFFLLLLLFSLFFKFSWRIR